MQTGYSGTKGNCPRYVCARASQLYGLQHGCQSLGGRRLEQRVLAEVFAVLEPACLQATATALAEADAHHAARLRAFELQVERGRFEADRARRQFDQVEPENRLVARTLERAWEQRLAELRQAEADLAAQQARRPVRLTATELAWLQRAGADLRRVFEAPTTTARERKQLLRAVISEVVVTVDAAQRTAGLRIVWQGGATSQLTMPLTKTGGHFRTHRRGHRRTGAAPGCALRRHPDRPDPVPSAPTHRQRPAVYPRPGRQPARLPRHPRLPTHACRGGRR
jgi:hypothetical protein